MQKENAMRTVPKNARWMGIYTRASKTRPANDNMRTDRTVPKRDA